MNKTLVCGVMITLSSLTLSGCFAPLVIAGVAGAGAANVAGSSVSVGTQVSDTKIKTQVIGILHTMNNQLAYQSNVEVTVFNGIVLLLGQVPSQAISNSIAKQTSAIEGVNLVYNQLTVGPSVTFTTYTHDAWITAKVKSSMIGTVDPLHFKVVTQQGIVYLMGRVTKTEGESAANAARQVPGVKQVVEAFSYIVELKPTLNPMPASTSSPNPPAAPAQTQLPQAEQPASSNSYSNGAGPDASD